jgi:hypothetical protein
MTPKLKITNYRYDNGWNDRHEVHFDLDDKRIGEGSYGGEPEDNSAYRDYAWVQETIINLCKELGIEVEIEDKENDPEE